MKFLIFCFPRAGFSSRGKKKTLPDNRLKGQNDNAKVEKNRITMPNGGKYEEPIPKLEISDALQLDVSQVESLDNINNTKVNLLFWCNWFDTT